MNIYRVNADKGCRLSQLRNPELMHYNRVMLGAHVEGFVSRSQHKVREVSYERDGVRARLQRLLSRLRKLQLPVLRVQNTFSTMTAGFGKDNDFLMTVEERSEQISIKL